MKTIKYAVIALVLTSLGDYSYGQLGTPVSPPQYRQTHRTSANVAVYRVSYTSQEIARITMAERRYAKLYPEAVLLRSGLDYELANTKTRNCHDFAWGPYMSCMCNIAGTQKEAWWMDDPSQNWKDDSMRNVVSSLGGAVAPSVGPKYTEYTFKSSEISPLQFTYQDIFGFPLLLPVCPIDNLQTQIPVHSAVLLYSFTTPTLNPAYSVGMYISKWGTLGIYRHRWGSGYTPKSYNGTQVLRVFAPRPGWNPPLIVHSPWGL